MHRHFYMMKRSRKLISANKGETIMSNTVITIARQYGSGGRTVGKMLAKRLDIPCYDREIISLASEESGIHPTLFQDEKKKHGSLRAFLTGGFKNASPLPRKAQVLQRMTIFFAIRQKSSASSQRKAPALSSDAAPTISLQMFQALSVSLSTRPKIFVCRKQ